LKSIEDLKCDDRGCWLNNSNKKFRFVVDKGGNVSKDVSEEINGPAVVLTLKREYFCLKDGILNDFRKRINVIYGPNGMMHRYCLVQYSFKGGAEHSIELRPHGNCKSRSTGYIRTTWTSTKTFLKSASEESKPGEVVYKTVTEELGDLPGCSGIGQLPRGRQQVKARDKTSVRVKNISGAGKQDGPWFRLLGDCKKQASDRKSAFIRDVKVAPEPMCVLTTDRQLNDMVRFCCNPVEFKPFTEDPTFDIGDYIVTPITYLHLLLENRKDGKHPSMIGPVLIHEKKTTETYSVFSRTLKSLNPGLGKVLAFGTDGEKALVTAYVEDREELSLKLGLEMLRAETCLSNSSASWRNHGQHYTKMGGISSNGFIITRALIS